RSGRGGHEVESILAVLTWETEFRYIFALRRKYGEPGTRPAGNRAPRSQTRPDLNHRAANLGAVGRFGGHRHQHRGARRVLARRTSARSALGNRRFFVFGTYRDRAANDRRINT